MLSTGGVQPLCTNEQPHHLAVVPCSEHQLKPVWFCLQDVVVDASDEDLPVEWVKRQRRDGSYYYRNTMTGAERDTSPHEGVADAPGAPEAARARRGSRIPLARMFKVRAAEINLEIEGRIGHRRKTLAVERHF